MKQTCVLKKIINLLFLISVVIFLSSPCFAASKKDKKKNSKTQVELPEEKNEIQTDKESTVEEEKTYIPIIDSVKKKTFFSSIDLEIVSLVEEGTPASLQSAMLKIRKNESEYTEPEKILIQIATEIMNFVWPSQKVTWQTFSVDSENAYIGAINSVKKGVFDSSTGNTDFFTTLLPVFVLLNSNQALSFSEYYDDMEKALHSAQELRANSVLPEYLLAILYEKKGDFSSAIPLFRSVYKQTDENFDSSLAYARILNKGEFYNQASVILQKLLLENPTDLKVLKQIAYTEFNRREFTLSEEYVARVLQQTPNDLEFVLLRAKILVEKNDYIHAVSLLDMYSKQDNSSLDYLLLRTRVQLDWSRNTTAATETIEKALQKYPENPDALMLAARISSITDSPVAGKYADELATMVLQIAPENRDARIYALEGLMQRENWSEAYDVSKKLVELGNSGSQVIFNHIKNCINLGKKSEALEIAKKYFDKSDEILQQAYVYAYTNAGKNSEAIEIINSMMADASPKFKSYLYYSRSFLQPNIDSSLADLRSCLIANPRNSDALLRLYEIYYEKQDYRKAQYYLRQVVAINPNDNSFKKMNESLTQLIK